MADRLMTQQHGCEQLLNSYVLAGVSLITSKVETSATV